jgi:hypothetical protein
MRLALIEHLTQGLSSIWFLDAQTLTNDTQSTISN